MVDVKTFSYEELLNLLNKEDQAFLFEERSGMPDATHLTEILEKKIDLESFTRKTVLGIDIYQYSQYEPLTQSLVPFIFQRIYKEAARLSKEQSGYFFQHTEPEDFEKEFINTGDGGFQIFQTPLHAISYAIHFELIVRYYNSFHFYPKLRKLVGPINLRYALTHDRIFKLEDNFYGPVIINNDRILSKDSLNRFLLDENTFNWFMFNLNGIENLQFVSVEEINKLPEFDNYTINEVIQKEHVIPHTMDFSYQKIISADIQKIGDIHAKSTSLSIYNFHLQYLGGMKTPPEADKLSMTTVSVGNLNTSGINA